MGFFDKKEKTEKICVNCGGKVKPFSTYEIAEGYLCKDCGKKCGYDKIWSTKKKTLSDVEQDMKINSTKQALLDNFNPTKKIDGFLAIDEINKQWITGKVKKDSKVYNFKDIVNFELIDLGSAKECSMLRIKISIINADTSSVDIKFFESGAFSPTFKRDSFVYRTNYKFAQECMALLHLIKAYNLDSSKDDVPQLSAADEILKFKNLLDSGIITQDEFDTKKKQLLDI